MAMNAIKMKVITVQFPIKYLQAMGDLVQAKFYPSRNELIRLAVRDLLLDVHGWMVLKPKTIIEIEERVIEYYVETVTDYKE